MQRFYTGRLNGQCSGRPRKPIGEVEQGETFVIEASLDTELSPDRDVEKEGPVFVSGVKAGDVLAIHIADIVLSKWWGADPDYGMIPEILELQRVKDVGFEVPREGDELILPPVPGVAGPRPAGPGDSADETAPSGVATEPSPAGNAGRFRWYQVKEGDRYASIARDELSNERRWREIFELNQDKFPDPHLIRPGVRIKLPLLAVADTTGVRP